MYAIIGVIIGLFLRNLVYEPYKRKKIRAECIREGLAPKEEWATPQ